MTPGYLHAKTIGLVCKNFTAFCKEMYEKLARRQGSPVRRVVLRVSRPNRCDWRPRNTLNLTDHFCSFVVHKHLVAFCCTLSIIVNFLLKNQHKELVFTPILKLLSAFTEIFSKATLRGILINMFCFLADFGSGSSCSGVTPTLGKGCRISDDCSTITCNMDFVNKPITFKLEVFI